MAVNGVSGSDGVRTEQVQTDRRAEENRAVRRDEDLDRAENAQHVPEAGRGENMDVTA